MRLRAEDVLSSLQLGGYVSGEAIAARLGVSRSYVAKCVRELCDRGYVINGVPRRGLILESIPPDGGVGPTSPRSSSTPEEQPADKAADRASSLPGPPPFAGFDLELYTIAEVLHLIERLDGEERRRRVAAYVCARFL